MTPKTLLALLPLGLIVACATPEVAEVSSAPVTCTLRDAPVGTRIVRRDQCTRAATPEEREQAKRQAEALAEEQLRGRVYGTPGRP